MSVTAKFLADRFTCACESVKAAEGELTEIDSHFGDADHGVTMVKIAQAIEDAVKASSGGIKSMLDDAASAVMMINGGSAVPLWNTWLDGMQEAAPAADEMELDSLRAMFGSGLKALSALSKAKVGDKTMMDALIPATAALMAEGGTAEKALDAAALAARDGAEATRNFVSKFGRARSYGEQTLGTPDAGAVSMAYFFAGLAKK
jgi:dihydroxyacetone kinase-like protein